MEELVQDYGHEDTSKSLPTLNRMLDRPPIVNSCRTKTHLEQNGMIEEV